MKYKVIFSCSLPSLQYVSSRRKLFIGVVQKELNRTLNITRNNSVLKISVLYTSQNYPLLFVLFIFICNCISHEIAIVLLATDVLVTLNIYVGDILAITNRNDNSEWSTSPEASSRMSFLNISINLEPRSNLKLTLTNTLLLATDAEMTTIRILFNSLLETSRKTSNFFFLS